MPVDPNNPHVDVAHERTRVSADFRYSGCYNQPRPYTTTLRAQDGWHPDGRARFIEITSVWQQISAAKVELVWTRAHQFQTWDLHEFMARPPSKSTIQRTRRVLQLSGVLK